MSKMPPEDADAAGLGTTLSQEMLLSSKEDEREVMGIFLQL